MGHRHTIVQFLKTLRSEIIASFESLESTHRFVMTPWNHPTGGGGEINLLRGDVFEKGAVNWSGVSGPVFPMDDGKGPFFATGVSLVTHMSNPHAPTAHMNVRYIETEDQYWFGGGYDLTPMGFPYEEDRVHFHAIAQTTLDSIDTALYPKFSQAAKEYFFIPHRQKERGMGGIFFDHVSSGNILNDLTLWQQVGKSFLSAIMPIYQRRVFSPFSPQDREKQLLLRSHYVEFNLMYDRGTRFGFLSGGNPDAILCSMPPLVRW